MKKVIVSCLVGAGLLVGGIAVAHSVEDRVERLKERLELNEKQTESVQKIFADAEKKQKSLRDQMRTLHEETRKQFEAVLTEEQLKKLEEVQKPRRGGKRGHHRKGGHRRGFFSENRSDFVPERYGYFPGPRFGEEMPRYSDEG